LLCVNGGEFNGVLYHLDGMTVSFILVNPKHLQLIDGIEITFKKDYITKN
jgi:Fe-S cluster assembly iron-binding protein IscA